MKRIKLIKISQSFGLEMLIKFRPVFGALRTITANYCATLEERLVRQQDLFDRFSSNVGISDDENLINVNGIRQLYPYLFDQKSILGHLYNAKYDSTNMFDWPEAKSFGKVRVVERTEQTKFLQKAYSEQIEELNKKNSVQRILHHSKKYGTIVLLKQGDNYDRVKIDFPCKDSNGRTLTRQDFEDHLENKKLLPEERYTHIVEHFDSKRQLDSLEIESILEAATSDKYINKLGGVTIKNKFTGSGIYEMKPYDLTYGSGSFIKALLGNFSFHYDGEGTGSIKYHKTITCINNIAKKLFTDTHTAVKMVDILIDNSTHTHGDTQINITKLMNKYKIGSHELLYTMFFNNAPFGMGILDTLGTEYFNLEKAKEIIEKREFVDYLHGRPIKNYFRLNANEQQTINIKKYDDRTSSGRFYECVLKLIYTKT